MSRTKDGHLLEPIGEDIRRKLEDLGCKVTIVHDEILVDTADGAAE